MPTRWTGERLRLESENAYLRQQMSELVKAVVNLSVLIANRPSEAKADRTTNGSESGDLGQVAAAPTKHGTEETK